MMIKEAGKQIPVENMDKAQKHNEDGYGVSWYEDDEIKTYKTFDYDMFKKVLGVLEEFTLVIHLRYATKGDKSFENIHPFEIPSGVMFHNGTIFGMDTIGSKSDSVTLANMISDCDFNYIEDVQPLVQHFVDDKINRLVFFEDNGRITIINEELGIKEDGIWYSNDYHLKDEEWCRYGCKAKTKKEEPKVIANNTSKKGSPTDVRKHKVFVYGTLKRGYSNNRLLKYATFLGKAKTLVKWTMISNSAGSFPYLLEPSPILGEHIQGEVYAVSTLELGQLDRLEGVPHHYLQKRTSVRYDDDSTLDDVLVYVKATVPEDYLMNEELIANWTK